MRRSGLFALVSFILLAAITVIVSDKSYANVDDDKVITIKAVGSSLQYETTRLELEAGTEVTIRLDNSESSMPHNLVLLKNKSDIREVALAGLEAQESDYVPEGKSGKIVAHTALAKPGDVVEVTFEVPPAGKYPYVCTYPGHFQTMRGTLVSTESE